MNAKRRTPLIFAALTATTVLVTGIAAFASPVPTLTSTRKYFLHIDIPSASVTATFEMYLSVVDRPDEGSGSINVNDGLANELYIATGAREPVVTKFPSIDGGPFRLAPSAPITGEIVVTAFRVNVVNDTGAYVGGGASTLELELKGKLAGGKRVTLGTQQIDYIVTPAQDSYTLMVDIEPPARFMGERFTSITLSTLFRGAAAAAGAIELDDPAAYIEVPILN